MFQIIDGKKISQEIKDELKEKVSALKTQGKTICLAVIQVGSDPASSVYVGNKKKACAYIGIESLSYELTEETTWRVSPPTGARCKQSSSFLRSVCGRQPHF